MLRRILRRLFAPLIACFVTPLLAVSAWACSCMLEENPDAFVAGASVIVNATQLRIEPCKSGGNLDGCVIGTFRVNEIFKGPPATELRVRYHRAMGTSCGFGLPDNVPLPLAAYGDAESGYETGGCTQYAFHGSDNSTLKAALRYRHKLSIVDRALLASPDDPNLLRRKARFLTRNREIDQGLQTIEMLLARAPNDPAGLSMKAELLAAKGKDAEARAILDAAIAARGDTATREWTKLLAQQGRKLPEGWLDFEGLEATNFNPYFYYPLNGASFRNARLVTPNLSYQALQGADFTNAVLVQANLDSADLTGATLYGAQIDGSFRQTIFKDADLENVRASSLLFGPRLDGAWALSADFAGVEFINGSAINAVLAYADFSGASLGGFDLAGANLSHAKLSGAYLQHASFQGADLTGAKLAALDGKPADLRKANLEGAILDQAVLTTAIYDCETRWPAGFDPGARGAIRRGGADCGTKADFSWLKQPFTQERRAPWMEDSARGQMAFAGEDLAHVSFRGAWLPTDNFVGANLYGADFAHFRTDLDMRGANLTDADLSFVDLMRWKIDGSTKLSGVKLRGSHVLIQAVHPDLAKMDFRGAILHGRLPDGVDPAAMGIVFYGGNSKNTYLRGADLKGYNLRGVNFSETDLSGADLRGAILNDVNLRGAILTGAQLKGACYAQKTRLPEGFDPVAAELVYCGSHCVSFDGSGVQRCDLPPPEMPVPDLTGEDLSERVYRQAFLLNARMDKAVAVHTSFDDAHMKGASLQDANLTGASLVSAVLQGANLTGASLRGADLRGANLHGANLTRADLTDAAYNLATVWPAGFDPAAVGAVRIEE